MSMYTRVIILALSLLCVCGCVSHGTTDRVSCLGQPSGCVLDVSATVEAERVGAEFRKWMAEHPEEYMAAAEEFAQRGTPMVIVIPRTATTAPANQAERR